MDFENSCVGRCFAFRLKPRSDRQGKFLAQESGNLRLKLACLNAALLIYLNLKTAHSSKSSTRAPPFWKFFFVVGDVVVYLALII